MHSSCTFVSFVVTGSKKPITTKDTKFTQEINGSHLHGRGSAPQPSKT